MGVLNEKRCKVVFCAMKVGIYTLEDLKPHLSVK